MLNLGDVGYDIRFLRQKAQSDLAAIEADANAMVERVKGRMAGIGFGGGGSNGVAHNGANGANGQPMAQAVAPSNGAASRFIQQAAEQNAALAAAAKNPVLRAGYQGNPSTIGPSLASQLGVSVEAVHAAFTGRNNGQPKAINGNGGVVNGGSASVLNGNGGGVIHVHVTNWPAALGGAGGGGAGGTGGQGPMAGVPGLGRFAGLARGVGIAAAAVGGASYLVNSVGDIARSHNEFLQDQLSAGSNPYRLAQAEYANFRRMGFAGEGAFVNRIPIAGGVYQSGQDVAEAAANLSNKHLGTQFGTPAFLAGMDQKLQFNLMMSQNFVGSGRDMALSQQGRMKFSPFGARMNALEAEREFADKSLNVQRTTMLLGATTDEQRKTVNSLIDIQKKTVGETFNSNASGLKTELNMNNTILRASIIQKDYEANLRPVGGMARATEMTATALFNEQMKAADLIQDPDMKNRAKKNARSTLRDTIGTLNVDQTGVLKNIFGGRPTEINALQSIEAMKDISPETNAVALKDLTDAIKRLTDLWLRN